MRANGASRARPYDRWFRYPAGFSAETLQSCFTAVGELPDESLIIDPFCGAATVGTEALRRKLRFVGLEAHPLIAHLGRVKLSQPQRHPDTLIAAADLVGRAEPRAVDTRDEAELVKRCFDEASLATLCGLREQIAGLRSWRAHLTWALLGTLRDVAHSKVGWPYQRPSQRREAPHSDAARRFSERVDQIAEDLAQNSLTGDGRVFRADARSQSAWTRALGRRLGAASISSPPYLNNFDYADATRLELYFMGRVRSWSEMCERVRSGMLVATTQQSRVALAKRDARRLERWSKTAERCAALRGRLSDERSSRPRGKEYDLLLPSYFAGCGRVLEHLHRFLHPGARAAWVVGDSAPYGVYVGTPDLLAGLAVEIGFDHLETRHIRDRGTRWRSNGSRHQEQLSEKLIVLRVPMK